MVEEDPVVGSHVGRQRRGGSSGESDGLSARGRVWLVEKMTMQPRSAIVQKSILMTNSGPAPTTAAEWQEYLGTLPQAGDVVDAEELIAANLGGLSNAFCVRCTHGDRWVLKRFLKDASCQNVFNDQTVARVAHAFGAPIPAASVVRVSEEFIERHHASLGRDRLGQPRDSGHYHGSRLLEAYGDVAAVGEELAALNRSRAAKLCILYGWTHAADHQRSVTWHSGLVWSLDHNLFLTKGGELWTPELLRVRAPAGIDSWAYARFRLQPQDLDAAMPSLCAVTPEDVARAIRASPDEWGVTLEFQAAVADFLWRRRDDILQRWRAGSLEEGMYVSKWST